MSELNPDIQKEIYNPGDFIFFEGDIDFHFYIIDQGEVQIFTKNVAGVRVDIATMGPGESFGEFALLDGSPRSASAQALTHVKLIKVSAIGFEQLLQDLPVWASSMLRNFSQRLKRMTDVLKKSPQFFKKDDGSKSTSEFD